MSHIELETIAY